MQVNVDEGNQSYPYDSSTVTEIVNDFVEAADVPETAAEPFEKLLGGMAQQIQEAEQDAAQARGRAREAEARVEELETELSQNREESAKDRASMKQRVSSLEEAEEADPQDENPTPSTGNQPTQNPETPLEDITRMPEHLAEKSLSRNQQRTRFVSKDIHQYSRSVPAGRALKSSELRRILAASQDGSTHTETVSRVIDMVVDLGEEEVKLRETRGGERVIIFSDEIVERIVAFRNTDHPVVAEGGATG